MPGRKPCDQAIEVIAEEREVIIEGPPHMVTSMTPEAAEESSNRLYECCAKARGQQIMKPDPVRPKK
jgi:hypothetical protein